MESRTKWLVDHAHSVVGFKVSQLKIGYVKGSFNAFDTTIYTTARDFTITEIDLRIDAASFTTGNEKCDEYFKSVDPFDIQNHRQIIFISNSVRKLDWSDNYESLGLTIKSITRPVKLKFEKFKVIKWGSKSKVYNYREDQ